MSKLTYEIAKERERSMRLHQTVNKAVDVVKRYEKAYEKMKAERDALKKELASKKTKNGLTLSMLEIRNKLRKVAHPDKHSDPKVKKAVNDIFILIEEIFNEE